MSTVIGMSVPSTNHCPQEFLTLWKGAEPDIPILKQAKAEYAKLH